MKDFAYKDALALFEGQVHLLSLLNGLHGLEKESLRITEEGDLALTPHPKGLSPSLTHPHITTDFSESQLELITPPQKTVEESLKYLENLHAEVYENLENDELVWPLSMPARLPEADLIPLARYGDSKEGQEREIYRRALALRYGKMMQTISGVHYNFSFNPELWSILAQHAGKEDIQSFQNEAYMSVVRNFLRTRWILSYLFGASPEFHSSYTCEKMKVDTSKAISLRSSRCGYSNPAKIEVSFNDFRTHLRDIRRAVETIHAPYTALGLEKDGVRIQLNDHLLQQASEYYAPIRIKPPQLLSGNLLESLEQLGSGYLEVRIFDLNPFSPIGVDLQELEFTHLFLIYCLLDDSPELSREEFQKQTVMQQELALKGRELSPELRVKAMKIFNAMKPVAILMRKEKLLEKFRKEMEEATDLPWKKILDTEAETHEDFLAFGLRKAREHKHYFLRTKP